MKYFKSVNKNLNQIFFEDDSKKANLVEHICMLLTNLEATQKVIDQEVVLNEDHILNAESLNYDIEDSFQDLYRMDPSYAFQLSQGHDLLGQMFRRLDAVIYLKSRAKSPHPYIMWNPLEVTHRVQPLKGYTRNKNLVSCGTLGGVHTRKMWNRSMVPHVSNDGIIITFSYQK